MIGWVEGASRKQNSLGQYSSPPLSSTITAPIHEGFANPQTPGCSRESPPTCTMASLLMAPAALRPVAAPHGAQRPARRSHLVTLASVADDARATHTAAEHLRAAGGKRMPEPCGLDPQVQAARLKLAPQSVQDFIMRWGHREGINSAYQACPVSWEVSTLGWLEAMHLGSEGSRTVDGRE